MTSSGGALLALALWSASPIDPSEPIERVTPQLAAERAAECGLGRVTIRYDDELQLYILSAPNVGSATETQLACLDKSIGWSFFVELPPSVQPRFDAIREARMSALVREEARKWLAARGLLEKVPNYVPGATDEAAFTREVERLCGPRALGAFQSRYGFHTLSPDWMRKIAMPRRPEDIEALSCIGSVTTVAGFELGFLGNEAYAPGR